MNKQGAAQRHKVKELPQPITRQYLATLRRKALRTGKWFKIPKMKRAALEAAIKAVQVVRSPVLLQIVEEIMALADPPRHRLIQAYRLGLKILQARARQAIMLGLKGYAWLRDKKYIIQVGLSALNLPPPYRPVL